MRTLALFFAVKWCILVDFIRVFFRYYLRSWDFFKADFLIILSYFWKNPYRRSREYLEKTGESDLYTYGETPLITVERISKECALSSEDVIYELGCGRGRTVFWLDIFLGAKAVGVDYVPFFIKMASRVKKICRRDNIRFVQKDILGTNFSDATVVYFYGTGFESNFIKRLIKKLGKLKKGSKIITVSYPLSDYGASFPVIKHFKASFFWGEAEVFLQIVS